MKPLARNLCSLLVLCFPNSFVRGQSTLEFQTGTHIEVTTGANICADNVTISGTYSGSGTQCGNALPVEFVAMSAVAAASEVVLRWTTATETDNYGFEVERREVGRQISVDGRQSEAEGWESVAFIPGMGTSSSPTEYSYVDKGREPGRYAYRLRQIDRSGSYVYLMEVEVEVLGAPSEFMLARNYPNPFNPSTSIEFSVPDNGDTRLDVVDITGRQVASLYNGTAQSGRVYNIRFDATELTTGLYFARLSFAGRSVVRKMVLAK